MRKRESYGVKGDEKVRKFLASWILDMTRIGSLALHILLKEVTSVCTATGTGKERK